MPIRVAFVIPMQLPSVANLREHWGERKRRSKEQRTRAQRVMISLLHEVPLLLACKTWQVEFTRLAPRELDGMVNLPMSLKAVQDGIADALPVKDDRDPRVTWTCSQEKGLPREYALRVEVRGDA